MFLQVTQVSIETSQHLKPSIYYSNHFSLCIWSYFNVLLKCITLITKLFSFAINNLYKISVIKIILFFIKTLFGEI